MIKVLYGFAVLIGIFAVALSTARAGVYTTTYIVNGKVVTCTTFTDQNGNPINVVCN